MAISAMCQDADGLFSLERGLGVIDSSVWTDKMVTSRKVPSCKSFIYSILHLSEIAFCDLAII